MSNFADGISYKKPTGGGISLRDSEVSGGGAVGGAQYWYVSWSFDAPVGFTGDGWIVVSGGDKINLTGYNSTDATIIARLRADGGWRGLAIGDYYDTRNTACGYVTSA